MFEEYRIRHKVEIIKWKHMGSRIMVNYQVGTHRSNVVYVDKLPKDTSNVEMVLEDTGTVNGDGKRVFPFRRVRAGRGVGA